MTDIDDTSERTDREDVLELLADTIETTHARVETFEAGGPEEERLLIKWVRTLGYLSGQYRKLLQDEDLDEMAAELDALSTDGGP